MNAPITLRDKWLAIGCYLSGLLYLPALVLLVSKVWDRDIFSLSLDVFFGLPLAIVAMLFFLPLLTWKIMGRYHPFVDLAGRTAFNLALSFLVTLFLAIIFWLVVASSTCGISALTPNPSSSSSSLFSTVFQYSWMALQIVTVSTWLIHSAFSAFGIITALRGEVPVFPLPLFLHGAENDKNSD
jgi:uncharacterized Tic20 family protein